MEATEDCLSPEERLFAQCQADALQLAALRRTQPCVNVSSAESSIDETSPYTCAAAADSIYTTYAVTVDPQQGDKATDIPLYSFVRPHMRAFHMAWMAFFVAFFTWFAMTPLLGEIATTLDLNHDEIWTSSILAVAGSALTRILIGPLNDQYGARSTMAAALVLSAIPTAVVGLVVHSAMDLYLVRLFIGLAGSAFVTCQFWTSSMFTFEIAGTANALAAGWGNLGAGVAQLVMGSLLFPLLKLAYGGSSEQSWRTIFVVPAVLSMVMAVLVLRYADDTPKGNVRGRASTNSPRHSLVHAASSSATWFLALQYGCSFGVEITMTQAAALYFFSEFGQSTESSAALASVFGWMNLFARGLGGYASDMANAKAGMRGRLWVQAVLLLAEGLLVIGFSYTPTLALAVITMVGFSILVQAAEGSTFGIVPYVSPPSVGSIAGLVGAGGNLGGVGFACLFRAVDDYRRAFWWMGCIVLASAFWTLFIRIPGHRGLMWGRDAEAVLAHRRKAKLPEVVCVELADAHYYE